MQIDTESQRKVNEVWLISTAMGDRSLWLEGSWDRMPHALDANSLGFI